MDADKERVAKNEAQRAEVFAAAAYMLQIFKPYSGE